MACIHCNVLADSCQLKTSNVTVFMSLFGVRLFRYCVCVAMCNILTDRQYNPVVWMSKKSYLRHVHVSGRGRAEGPTGTNQFHIRRLPLAKHTETENTWTNIYNDKNNSKESVHFCFKLYSFVYKIHVVKHSLHTQGKWSHPCTVMFAHARVL